MDVTAHEKQSNNISTAITSLPIITHVSKYTQIFKHLEKAFATPQGNSLS
jgi:hypothetical protein